MLNSMEMIICPVSERDYPFCENLVQTINYLFKMKFGTKTNSNMLNSVVLFICPSLYGRCLFVAKLVQAIKLSVYVKYSMSNSSILNSMVIYFSSLGRQIPFLDKFGPNNKIVSSRWYLVLILILISWIQWWCSSFPFGREIPFLAKFGSKRQNCLIKMKLGA